MQGYLVAVVLSGGLSAPFGQQDLPESVTVTLEDYATCARFNPSGRLIAAGRADGWGTIWDLDTQGVLRSLEGHTKAVTSVRSVSLFFMLSEPNDAYSWSRNSRYLLTSSRDWNCVLWDLEEADRIHTIRFECPVADASLHPHHRYICVLQLFSSPTLIQLLHSFYSKIAVAVLSSGQCFLIDMRHGAVRRDELLDAPLKTSDEMDEAEDASKPQ